MLLPAVSIIYLAIDGNIASIVRFSWKVIVLIIYLLSSVKKKKLPLYPPSL
jgi:hypothetical protein